MTQYHLKCKKRWPKRFEGLLILLLSFKAQATGVLYKLVAADFCNKRIIDIEAAQ